MLILRSTMVPIVGEAVPIPFNEQIELDGWDWDLKWEEKHGNSGGAASSPAVDPAAAKSPFKGNDLVRAISVMQNNGTFKQEERDKRVRDMVDKAVKAQLQLDKSNAATDDKKGKPGAPAGADAKDQSSDDTLKFTFKKNVDLASTQLLNSMKQAEVMPRAIITLFHRSSNAPVTLAITFKNVRLEHYALSVDVTDTMADLKEDWTASFEEVEYVYQNRPAASGPNFVTQGTVRVFKMLSKGLSLP